MPLFKKIIALNLCVVFQCSQDTLTSRFSLPVQLHWQQSSWSKRRPGWYKCWLFFQWEFSLQNSHSSSLGFPISTKAYITNCNSNQKRRKKKRNKQFTLQTEFSSKDKPSFCLSCALVSARIVSFLLSDWYSAVFWI